ncbi:hypothetical protein V466_28125 [Pseudomonas mandelii PD30]|uniref:Uncharacterized protein n=1 Tax=Pseudomonas mandelii PD30 TaxID=1419583 RepID=A0A059KU32_9PSED|nr:hypothetical protein V466_28125 [Pseudomonas mandelii PD30]
MQSTLSNACLIALPLLMSGCQSYSPPPSALVLTNCQPLPAPVAWFMEARAPDLTQRMLNELSESPTPATKD